MITDPFLRKTAKKLAAGLALFSAPALTAITAVAAKCDWATQPISFEHPSTIVASAISAPVLAVGAGLLIHSMWQIARDVTKRSKIPPAYMRPQRSTTASAHLLAHKR